jgi:hypothetical protein
VRRWDVWLSRWMARAARRFYALLLGSVGSQQYVQAQEQLSNAYSEAHQVGAIWALMDLTQNRPALEPETAPLLGAAAELGLLVTVNNPRVLSALGDQQRIANSRLVSALFDARVNPEVVLSRASVYAARWSVQQGIADAAEGSKAFDLEDNETELLKKWYRVAARREKRAWHDALNGKVIPYSQDFVLNSPSGRYSIFRPYDPKLPISEKIACGHGIIIILPEQASRVEPWDGN